jgi:hypothetical protein
MGRLVVALLLVCACAGHAMAAEADARIERGKALANPKLPQRKGKK